MGHHHRVVGVGKSLGIHGTAQQRVVGSHDGHVMLAKQPLLVEAGRHVGQVADGQVHLAALQGGLGVQVGHGQGGQRHTRRRIAQARQQAGQEERLRPGR
jgi:hypothetical protein